MAKARKTIAKNQTDSGVMSRPAEFWKHRGVAELAAEQGVTPLRRAEDLATGLWESNEEVDAFLADVYQARDAGVA